MHSGPRISNGKALVPRNTGKNTIIRPTIFSKVRKIATFSFLRFCNSSSMRYAITTLLCRVGCAGHTTYANEHHVALASTKGHEGGHQGGRGTDDDRANQ